MEKKKVDFQVWLQGLNIAGFFFPFPIKMHGCVYTFYLTGRNSPSIINYI